MTGGFRSLDFCNEVLENNDLDVIGFARPFLIDKEFPNSLIERKVDRIEDAKFLFKPRKMADMAEAGYYDYQIRRLAENKELKPNYSPYVGINRFLINEIKKGWF